MSDSDMMQDVVVSGLLLDCFMHNIDQNTYGKMCRKPGCGSLDKFTVPHSHSWINASD